MKQRYALTNFSNGLIDPRLSPKEPYKGAMDELTNMIPSVQGWVSKRGGTRYVGSFENGMLREFVYADNQSYLLAFGNLKIDIYKDRERIGQITSPYAVSDLFSLAFWQNGDVLYICSDKYQMKKLIRKTQTSFVFEDMNFTDGPYLPENTTAVTITPGAASATVETSMTLTASQSLFSSADVGRWVRIYTVSGETYKWAWLKISAVSSATVVTAVLKGGQTFAGATKTWRLGAFNQENHPSAVCIYANRLILGMKKYVFASMVEGLETFSPTKNDGSTTVEDKNGFTVIMPIVKSYSIRWLFADAMPVVGCENEVFTLRNSDYGETLTPSKVKAVLESAPGTDIISPIITEEGLFYVKKYAKNFLNYAYSYDSYRYRGDSITWYVQNLLRQGIKQVCYTAEPTALMFFVMKDGSALSCTLSLSNGVAAFAKHDFSGQVVSSASVPNRFEEKDDIYLLVKRRINNADVYYIEVMEKGFENGAETTQEAFFVDCGLSYNGETTAGVSGLTHLEGQTVAVLADGAVQTEKIVQNGQITLDTPASMIHVGIPFTAIMRPAQVSLTDIVIDADKKLASKAVLSVFDTVGLNVNGEEITFRKTSDKMGQAIKPFTGFKSVLLTAGWQENLNLTIESRQPLPFNLRAVYFEMTNN